MPDTRPMVLMVRPTPAGVDDRALRRLTAAVAAHRPGPVLAAHLDQGEPSLHQVLDDLVAAGHDGVLVVPVALPADRYLTTWTERTIANWRETRDAALEIRLGAGPSSSEGFAAALARLGDDDGKPVTASPAAFRSPAWSVLEVPDRHLFVCRGPRCTAHGAGATARELAARARGTGTQVSPVGCLGPCNLGPLVVEHPGGIWHDRVDAGAAAAMHIG
ncbi:(2Fe-2S) ferredoxin domain-containing protein [Pseudonocardia phyllosphaerae]|uniref:(2Fe-2S) ferredoxin domain-containing protein n=1 Tax=Pseudonocardia phyllosphaerae TaxID=3390502 RepID=UPI00397E111F